LQADNFNAPFVVRGGCKPFAACNSWTEKYLEERLKLDESANVEYYLDKTLQHHLDIKSLDDFFTIQSDLKTNEAIYLRDFTIKDDQLRSDSTPHLPNLLEQSIYLGDGYSSFHWHSTCHNAILNQVHGEKTLFFIAPVHYLPSQAYFSEFIQELPNDFNEKLQGCSSLNCTIDGKQIQLIKVTLQKGDSVFIPPHYWHNASGTSDSVSILHKHKRTDFSFVFEDARFFVSCYIGPLFRYLFPRSDEL
jgi:hypothetical protein